ncbi:MAG TPA: Hsp20/alpha crystallin family protein [bacterium]|nr:Hsp20/alpha crystallin family protein [bacterium]
MSSIIRWDPFEEVGTLRRAVDRLFDDVMLSGRHSGRTSPDGLPAAAWEPAVEMYEAGDEVVVRAEMPNVDPANVDVTVTAEAITIKGTVRQQEEKKDRSYYRRELRYGSYVRTLPLPAEVKGGDAKATYKDGVLEVKIPKAERAKPSSVKVQVTL